MPSITSIQIKNSVSKIKKILFLSSNIHLYLKYLTVLSFRKWHPYEQKLENFNFALDSQIKWHGKSCVWVDKLPDTDPVFAPLHVWPLLWLASSDRASCLLLAPPVLLCKYSKSNFIDVQNSIRTCGTHTRIKLKKFLHLQFKRTVTMKF